MINRVQKMNCNEYLGFILSMDYSWADHSSTGFLDAVFLTAS